MRSLLMGGGVDLPNVSYCQKENEVHYNPYAEPSPADDEIWYTSTDGDAVTTYADTSTYNGAVGYGYNENNDKLLILSNTYENSDAMLP